MSSGYYAPGAERGDRVRALFARIASRYDLINDVQSFGLHRLWKRRLIREAGRAAAAQRALDVCCGTGDLALRLAAAGHCVTGCDFSPEMLARARVRGPGLAWAQADARRLPFADGAFDLVTIGYGLRNLPDPAQGVQELLRVTRRGGRLLILDFGKPANPVIRGAYFAYLRVIVPVFGLLFCGDAAAYRYILDSLQVYPAQDGVSALLRAAGCADIKVVNFAAGAMSLHMARKGGSLGQGDDVALQPGGLVGQ